MNKFNFCMPCSHRWLGSLFGCCEQWVKNNVWVKNKVLNNSKKYPSQSTSTLSAAGERNWSKERRYESIMLLLPKEYWKLKVLASDSVESVLRICSQHLLEHFSLFSVCFGQSWICNSLKQNHSKNKSCKRAVDTAFVAIWKRLIEYCRQRLN